MIQRVFSSEGCADAMVRAGEQAEADNVIDNATIAQQQERINELEIQLKIMRDILDTPILEPFAEAVVLEAKHQRARHGDQHDAVKDAFDWFWALGYLGGKAARAEKDGDIPKALHHTVTAAALLANWHRHLIFRHNKTGEAGHDDDQRKGCSR